jgi:hypothetical protein
MSLDLGMEDDPPPPQPAIIPPKRQDAPRVEAPPEAELLLVSACMGDMDGALFRQASHLPDSAFTNHECRRIWAAMRAGLVFARDEDAFAKHTGLKIDRLLRVETAAGVGAGFSQYLREFETVWRQAEFLRIADQMVRTPDMDPEALAKRLLSLKANREAMEVRGLLDFRVPLPGDRSILLGNRYLCRGDGCILASSSGMGKSSIVMQAASTWGMGRAFFGVKPNGPLKSLVIQSEDSDGDVGEVAASIATIGALSDEDKALVNRNVIVCADRVTAGPEFIDHLRSLVARNKPDLVWINPLLAYMGGDINDAQDAGAFLRKGLNGVNTPGAFAYMVVHHTAKPPNADKAKERKWSDVMYDMTGSAELTNWSRAVISLRPGENEGEFSLVFAKRGRRAGATIVAGTADQYEEIGTSIPVQHTKAMVTPEGHKQAIPAIYWERRKVEEGENAKPGGKGIGGRSALYHFEDFKGVFPKTRETAMGAGELLRCAKQNAPGMGDSAWYRILKGASQDGLIQFTEQAHGAKKYWIGV